MLLRPSTSAPQLGLRLAPVRADVTHDVEASVIDDLVPYRIHHYTVAANRWRPAYRICYRTAALDGNSPRLSPRGTHDRLHALSIHNTRRPRPRKLPAEPAPLPVPSTADPVADDDLPLVEPDPVEEPPEEPPPTEEPAAVASPPQSWYAARGSVRTSMTAASHAQRWMHDEATNYLAQHRLLSAGRTEAAHEARRILSTADAWDRRHRVHHVRAERMCERLSGANRPYRGLASPQGFYSALDDVRRNRFVLHAPRPLPKVPVGTRGGVAASHRHAYQPPPAADVG